MENKEFYQWLVGLTDSQGFFIINYKQNSWSFVYKLNLVINNAQLLYYVKRKLNYGSVILNKKTKVASFQIKDHQVIKKVILPIFETYLLLTRKHFEYIKFKKALEIFDNRNISISEKNKIISNILNQQINNSYISPMWINFCNVKMRDNFFFKDFETFNNTKETKLNLVNLYNLVKDYKLNLVLSKYWLIGFLEIKANFNLIYENEKLVHEFHITQKKDAILLSAIKSKFHIASKIKYNEISNEFVLSTKNSRAIENIIDFFSGKNRNKTSMKGIKSLEFRIWARSYVKFKKYTDHHFMMNTSIQNKDHRLYKKTERLLKIKKLLDKVRKEKFKE